MHRVIRIFDDEHDVEMDDRLGMLEHKDSVHVSVYVYLYESVYVTECIE